MSGYFAHSGASRALQFLVMTLAWTWSPGVIASSPTSVDFVLQLSVRPDDQMPLVPGSTGELIFTVTDRSPHAHGAWGFHISSRNTLVPLGKDAPIRLTPFPENECHLQTYTIDQPSEHGLYYFMLRHAQFAETHTCRLRYEVLPAAAHGVTHIQFRTLAHDLGSILYYDLTPHNNVAWLVVGDPDQSAHPVPTLASTRLLLLASLFALLGVVSMRRRLAGR